MARSSLHAERLARLMPDGKAVWIPIDHGVSSWPVAGLTDVEALINELGAGGADAIIAHKGVVSRYCDSTIPMLMHISASTIHGGENSSNKVLVGSTGEAVERGASGVSVQVNLGDLNEHLMLERLGLISEQCHHLDIPLLGMIYPRGPFLKAEGDSTMAIAHAVRLGWELGCDAIKTSWPGSKEAFAEVVRAAPIPVLIAGGESSGDFTEVLRIVADAIEVGGAGVCMGRQIFEDENPRNCILALRGLIHDELSFEEACEVL